MKWKFKRQTLLFLPFLLTLCLVETTSGWQQTTTLRVRVVDQNQAQIPDATIRLKDATGSIQQTRSSGVEPVIFTRLAAGKYVLEVEAENFKPYAEEVTIKGGEKELTVKLEIADLREDLDVKLKEVDKALDPREGAFTGFLSRAQIEALPDDPEEMEKALRQIAGQDATIRVDGFTGGRLPPKSQIASIKIIRSNFDAEFHQAGGALVDITTRAGGSQWSGSFNFRFNDEALNARQPFAVSRRPSQLRDFDGNLSGPIIKKKTSLYVFVLGDNSFDTANIVAVLPSGRLNESAQQSTNSFYSSAKVTHNLSQTHSLNFTYDYSKAEDENLGVGGFDLTDRAYDLEKLTNQIRIADSGSIGDKLFNEVRLQLTDETSKIIPFSRDPTIIVLDAFSSGGAGVDNSNRQQSIYLADNLLWSFRNHALKVGGLIEYSKGKLETSDNQNGTFTFSSIADFLSNQPTTFTQRQAARRIDYSQMEAAIFIQDDIRLHDTFSLGLGLRYEWQNNLKDKNNFSPRLGFIWSPEKHARVVFRGGMGLFYDWLGPDNYGAILSQDASQQSETVIINPSFPNAFTSGTSDVLAQNFWMLAPDLKNPYTISSAIGVKTRLRRDLTLEALYRFTRGVHQFRAHDVNAPLVDSTRPDSGLGRITQVESSAFSERNALEISANGSLRSRLSYSINYTLAKTISDAEGIFSLPSDNNNLRADRSVASTDQRHRLYTFLGWKVRKNVSLSTIFTARSPLPYTITTGLDDNGDTIFTDRPFGIERNTLRGSWQKQFDMNLNWALSFGNKSGSGPLHISISSGESVDVVDWTKRFTIKFYASITNVFNQTNFINFVGVQTSPLFGQPVSANRPRRVETGIRFYF